MKSRLDSLSRRGGSAILASGITLLAFVNLTWLLPAPPTSTGHWTRVLSWMALALTIALLIALVTRIRERRDER